MGNLAETYMNEQAESSNMVMDLADSSKTEIWSLKFYMSRFSQGFSKSESKVIQPR